MVISLADDSLKHYAPNSNDDLVKSYANGGKFEFSIVGFNGPELSKYYAAKTASTSKQSQHLTSHPQA